MPYIEDMSTNEVTKYRLETQVRRTGQWVVSGTAYSTRERAQHDADTIFSRRQTRITAYRVEVAA